MEVTITGSGWRLALVFSTVDMSPLEVVIGSNCYQPETDRADPPMWWWSGMVRNGGGSDIERGNSKGSAVANKPVQSF